MIFRTVLIFLFDFDVEVLCKYMIYYLFYEFECLRNIKSFQALDQAASSSEVSRNGKPHFSHILFTS